MTKGLVSLFPEQLQPMPGHWLVTIRDKQLGIAAAIIESDPEPCETTEDCAASHKNQRMSVPRAIGGDDNSARSQRERTQAGSPGSKVLLLSQAFCEPYRNEQKTPEMREWHLQNQENA